MSLKKQVISYFGLILFLSGIGFFITFAYFIYEMVNGESSIDLIMLIFTLIAGATSIFLGHKLLKANE